MSAAKLYQRVCKAASLDAAVAKLSEGELTDLAEYLSGLEPTGGIPAQVFGMVTARLGGGKRKEKEVGK